MRISSSDLSLSGSSTRLFSQERSERLEMWVGQRPQSQPQSQPPTPPRAIGPSADNGLGKLLEQAAKTKASGEAQSQLDPQVEKILFLLEKLFGVKGARQFVQKMQALSAERGQSAAQVAPSAQAPSAASQPTSAGWGVDYQLYERSVETQSSSLTAAGKLTLDDGGTLAFTLDWSQSSVRIEERSVHLTLGDAVQLKDPLVLDLDGNGIRFSGGLATIDIDRDGKTEAVAKPAGADRIVALDGGILGARSGQAFSDLAQLDGDGNGWIDSGDAAYGRLQLWDGQTFSSLASGGVAAIATASVALPFTYRGSDGGLQAVGRRGGVFLANDGTAGAVAQVDLVA